MSGTSANITGVVGTSNGGTGATSASGARSNLGLGPLATMVPTGSASATAFLRGDGAWITFSTGTGGSAINPTLAEDGSIAGTGALNFTSGTSGNYNVTLTSTGTGSIVLNGRTQVASGGLSVITGGVTIAAGGLSVITGGVSVSSGGATIVGGINSNNGSITSVGSNITGVGAMTLASGAGGGGNNDLTLATTGTGSIQMQATGGVVIASGNLRFKDTGTKYVGFAAPNVASTNTIWTLPTSDGTAGQILKTDGAGVLSWITPTVSAATVTAPWSNVTGTPTTLSGYGITNAVSNALTSGQIWVGNASNAATAMPLSGDASLSSSGVVSLGTTGVTAGTYGSVTIVPQIVVDAKGRITSVTAATITASGGTSQWTTSGTSISFVAGNVGIGTTNPSATLDVAGNFKLNSGANSASFFAPASGGSLNYILPNSAGSSGQVLTTNGTGTLSWATPSAGTVALSPSGVSAGTYGTTSLVPTITVDTYGRITSVTTATVAAPWASVTGTPTTLSGYGITNAVSTALTSGQIWVGNGSNIATAVALSGDASISNTGVVSLGTTGVTAGTYGSSATVPQIAVDAKGRITSVTAATITASGGTGSSQWTTSGTNISYSTGNVGIGTNTPSSRLSVDGVIETLSGGIKFPDGTIQNSSATSGTNSSMVSGWPDAIICNVTNPNFGTNIFYAVALPYSNGIFLYRLPASNQYDINFNSNGTFNSYSGITTTNCNTSMATLKLNGKTFNFAKGSAYQWLSGSGNSISYSVGSVGIGTATPLATLDVAGNLKLNSGTNSASFFAPASGGSLNYILPVTAGSSGQVLSTDGAGTLTWVTATASGGTGSGQWTNGSNNAIYYNNPQSAGDTDWTSVRLMLHLDGANGSTSFTDSTGIHAITPSGSASISTTQSKFGGSSGYFGGGGYLTPASVSDMTGSNLISTTSNFTIEMWVFTTGLSGSTGSGTPGFGDMLPGSATNYWSFGVNDTGKVQFYWYTGVTNFITSTASLSQNTWHHIALNSAAGSVKIYIDGIADGTGTISGNPAGSTGQIIIGQYNGNVFPGYIDDLRITKGTFRYGSNFTPSATAFLNGVFGGEVGIGTSTPSYTLDVKGTLRVTDQAVTNTGNGNFTVLSDARYKDIHGPFNRGLYDILLVDTVRFNYIYGNPLGSDPSKEYIGVTAQNLQVAIPEAVNIEKDGYLTVNSSSILWALINAVKDLYHKTIEQFQIQEKTINSKVDGKEFEILKSKMEHIEKENLELKERIQRLEKSSTH